MESLGIGRPSTYATITQTLLKREYIILQKKVFFPTSIGRKVAKILVELFSDYFNVKFTAKMEDELDNIEEKDKNWIDVIDHFYKPLEKLLEKVKKMNISKIAEEKADIKCDKCDGELVIKFGRNGEFLACSNYPKCKNTKNFKKDDEGKIQIILDEQTSEKCDKCGSDMIIKHGRFGKFFACSAYPKCKNTKPLKPVKAVVTTDEDCPNCGNKLVIKESKFGNKFLGCSNYPKCKFIKPFQLDFDCPNEGCDGKLTERRNRKSKSVFYSCSNYPKCDFATNNKPIKMKCPDCSSSYMLKKINKEEYECPICKNTITE